MFLCKLKTLRESKGISQKELSDKTGIRLPTISEMERCVTKSCSLENLDKLCSFFKCTLNDIYEFSNRESVEICEPYIPFFNSDTFLFHINNDKQDNGIVNEQFSVLQSTYKELDFGSQAKLLVYAGELKKQSAENK